MMVLVREKERVRIRAGAWLRDAIRQGLARIVACVPASTRGLGPSWAIELGQDETILATRDIPVLVDGEQVTGQAALVVAKQALPPGAGLTDEQREAIVHALSEALLREVV